MNRKAAITVARPRAEVEQRWRSAPDRPSAQGTSVTFARAPGGRGTEIHVTLEERRGGALAAVAQKLTPGPDPLAKVKDDLRRFKQELETGIVPRSDGTPEGESVERKARQRPAQPLSDDELQEVGVR